MKKILLAALALVVITGCAQNEEVENAAQKAQVSFRSVINTATKVAPMVTADFTTFTVNAYNTGANAMADGVELSNVFMPDVTATFANSAWTIDKGPFYWPMTDKIQFFAYSPATNVKTGYAAATGFPSFSYTIQAVDDQEDLLASKALDQTKASSAAGVGLAFSHLLTQINFAAELEAGITYTISKIEIVGVKNTGTFKYGTGTSVGAWAPSTETANYIYAGNYAASYTESAVATVDFAAADKSNALMLLPQTLPSTAKIQVTYKAEAGTPAVTTFEGTKEVALTGTWAMAQNIRYKLKLSSDATAVVVKPTFTEWGTATDSELTPATPTPSVP